MPQSEAGAGACRASVEPVMGGIVPVKAKALEICDGRVRAAIRPDLGGGLGRFDHLRAGRVEPLFRPEPAGGARLPFDLASIILIPWSNRVSGGGFTFRGRRHPLAANVAGEPYPLHGNGFALPWEVVLQETARVELRCRSEGPGTYRYAAELSYSVSGGVLGIRLVVTNEGEAALPFGLGFHPWFVRTPDARLEAPADQVWLEDADHLPSGAAPAALPEGWCFGTAAMLPDGFVNNAFTGWPGRASVLWPARGLALDIEASALPVYILYAPGPDAGFFCFEPVSHVVDAFNLPGGAEANGMTVLEPGARMKAELRFACRTLAPET